MGNALDTGMMVVVIKLSGRTEKHMEDGEDTTRIESSHMMQYGRMTS